MVTKPYLVCAKRDIAEASQYGFGILTRSESLSSPLTLAESDGVLISSAISGGSLRTLLKEAVKKYSHERIMLDIELMRHDFPLPCRDGQGHRVSSGEAADIMRGREKDIFFDEDLCCCCLAYKKGGGGRFLLFDDVYSVSKKISLAVEYSIGAVALPYPEAGRDMIVAIRNMLKSGLHIQPGSRYQ